MLNSNYQNGSGIIFTPPKIENHSSKYQKNFSDLDGSKEKSGMTEVHEGRKWQKTEQNRNDILSKTLKMSEI